ISLRRALARRGGGTETGVDEFLDPLPLIRLGDEQIPLRVHREVVRAVKLPGPVPGASEGADDLQRLSIEDVYQLVRPVVNEQECLLGVGGEADVPHRSASERVLGDHDFAYEAAVLPEHLQAIVRAVAD